MNYIRELNTFKMIKLQEKSQTKKQCFSMKQNRNIGVLHYKCMPLIRKWGEGRWRHVMSECRFRHGLCFSGTNLGGTQKNLQSFGTAAISASLLLPRLFLCVQESVSSCGPMCRNTAQNYRYGATTNTATAVQNKKLFTWGLLSLQSYCSPIIFFRKVTSVNRRQQKLELALAALAHPD